MAASNTNQDSTDKFLRDLLECPVCMETIISVPVYQCTNGHVMCKICIEKLNNCPICRNDSALVRSLKLENIVQRLEGVQPENMGPTTAKPNLQKWGKGSVRDYGTSNGPNQKPRFEPNLQATPRQATPRQATPRQVTNNQDEEAALLQREWAENRERWFSYNSHHSMQATQRDWAENIGWLSYNSHNSMQAMPRLATPRQIMNNQDEEAALLQREHFENRDHLLPHNIHQATARQATPRQATLRQNNQNDEGALLLGWVENRPRSITNFFKNIGILFFNVIWSIILVILFPVYVFLLVIIFSLVIVLPFLVLISIAYFLIVIIIQLLSCGSFPTWETLTTIALGYCKVE